MYVLNKKISFGLDEKSIVNAIAEIQKFKQDIQKKADILRDRLAEEIKQEAQMGFNSSTVDDIISGGSPHTAEVTVDISSSGDITVIVANGEDAVWCEFGSGVYHNGSAGTSKNPYGVKLGYTIGSYGEGKGKQRVWGFYEDEEARKEKRVTLTRGTPATMPMFNAAQSVATRAINIAREVFAT